MSDSEFELPTDNLVRVTVAKSREIPDHPD